MAFTVAAGARFTLTVKFIDDGGQDTSIDVEIPFDTDLTTTINNAIAVANSYANGVTKLAVNDAWVKVLFTQGVVQTPAVGANKFMDGQITVSLNPGTTSLDEFGIVRIPDPVDSVRSTPTGKGKFVLNVLDPLITGVTDNYEVAQNATLSDGQTLATVDSGRVIVKKGKVKYPGS